MLSPGEDYLQFLRTLITSSVELGSEGSESSLSVVTHCSRHDLCIRKARWRSLKLLLRLITGKCELLRIVHSKQDHLQKVFAFENSLKLSKYESLRNLLNNFEKSSEEMAKHIVGVKNIKDIYYPKFVSSIECYLDLIVGYKGLINEIENLRKTSYSSDNEMHEKLLLQLWYELLPEEKLLTRRSKQWEGIGFQGDDPATDFRGMGLLGLHCLLYLSSKHKETANYILSHSKHPLYGYSFAIVGINITSLAFQLLLRGKLRCHFYSCLREKPSVNDFHMVFVHLFYEFDKLWMISQPKSIMEFEKIRNKFEGLITNELQHGLTFNFI